MGGTVVDLKDVLGAHSPLVDNERGDGYVRGEDKGGKNEACLCALSCVFGDKVCVGLRCGKGSAGCEQLLLIARALHAQ